MNMHTRTIRRIGCALAIAAILPLTSGCFGSFGLVQKVHAFNKDFNDSKWAQEGMFLLLIFPFTPVYGGSAVLDATFFNAVEFWTGNSILTSAANTAQPLGAAAQVQVQPTPAPFEIGDAQR